MRLRATITSKAITERAARKKIFSKDIDFSRIQLGLHLTSITTSTYTNKMPNTDVFSIFGKI